MSTISSYVNDTTSYSCDRDNLTSARVLNLTNPQWNQTSIGYEGFTVQGPKLRGFW